MSFLLPCFQGGWPSLLPFLLPWILPGFQLPPLLCLFACLVASSAGSCRRPFVCFQASRVAGLLCFRSCCRGSFQASSCRRSGAAAGVFSFCGPVKLPGIEALYQTIYKFNIYKTIQDHFSSCLFLLPCQKIPLVFFYCRKCPIFKASGDIGKIFLNFFSKKGLTNTTM